MAWDYAAYEYYLSALLLICAMSGMGATLTGHDFLQIVRAPLSILLTLILQVAIIPIVALGVTYTFALPTGIGVGLLVIAALPGGLFSNLLTYLGRGNVALSVSATAICSLGCLLTTTLVLKTFASAQLPDDFTMPAGRILAEILLCLLIPLLTGMAIRRLFPNHYLRIGKYCINASLVLLALVMLSALAAGRIHLTQYGLRTPLALIAFGVLSMWVAYAVTIPLRLPLANTFTIGVEVVVRNSHLGVLLKAALFPARDGATNELGDAVLFVVLFYGAVSLVIAGIEVYSHRNRVGLVFGWYARCLERAKALRFQGAPARTRPTANRADGTEEAPDIHTKQRGTGEP
jgi:BASS family bile acid:Na+ symporter